MVLGAIGMASSTAINLFLLNGMPSFPLPPNPKEGCLIFDDHREMWIVFNGKEWVDVNLKEHRCNLNEESIQD